MSWSDRYAMVFGAALAVALLGRPLVATVRGLATGVDPARLGAALALVMVAYAGCLALARLLGPVVLPAADAAWLVLSPLPRRSVLGRAVAALLVIAVAGGTVLGLAALSAFGAPDDLVLRLVAALVLGVGASAGGMAAAVLAQASGAWDSWLKVAITGIVLMAVLVAVLGGGVARQALTAVAGAPAGLAVSAAGLVAAGAAVLLRRAWAALDRIPARRILSSSVRSGRVISAAVILDPGALTWAAEDDHWRGRVPGSRRWPRFAVLGGWGRAVAPAWQEWRRARRRPGRLAALAGSAALPALAAQAAGGLSALSIGLLLGGALTAAVVFVTGARRDGDNPALARLLAVDGRALMAARALLPALTAGVWSSLALAGLAVAGVLPGGPWWPLGPALAPALAAAALRMAGRPPVDHAQPVIETPAGALPTGPVIWALTGVDLALLGCLPTLAALTDPAASPATSVVVQAVVGGGVLAAFLLRGGRRPAASGE
ncbi:DUF6297 family protein [Nonomuraea cavernae]|nr:DUF6297 family protein [Nonomuraea cavernae]MCA2188900.1 DUF6297 family protein [Nonomuraea cavernae]